MWDKPSAFWKNECVSGTIQYLSYNDISYLLQEKPYQEYSCQGSNLLKDIL